MDAFFAQVEERENPRFKEKPLVVGADPKEGKGRGVVSACNYLAREYGVHSALPISKAYELCSKAVFLPVNMELYQKVSEKIMEILAKYSKTIEQVSIDEAYLDISFANNYKKAESIAKKIKKEVLEKEKLTSTAGIGPNKLIAKIASSLAKPDGLLKVEPPEVQKFLNPLDIKKIPGIGPKTAVKLQAIGVNKIKELKKISKIKLKNMFGVVGEIIYERARGIDEEEVSSEEIIKSIGQEHTFEKDTRDPEVLFNTFEKIIKNVHQELIENKFYFKTITVICRFQGFETHTKSKTLKEPTNDFEVLKAEAKKLLLKFLVENPKLIRLVGLRVTVV